VRPDPESDVEPAGEPVDGDLEGDDEDKAIVWNTGTIQKKAQTKVHFGDAKASKQQSLPPTVEKDLGKVIPEKRKDRTDSESDPDSSDDEVTILKKLATANAYTEAALQKEVARKDQELKKADFREDNLRQKLDRGKRINFNLTAELQKKQAKNQPDFTIPRNVPLGSGSLGAVPRTNSVLDGLDELARNEYEQSKADRDARKAQRNSGPDLAYARRCNQFFHSSPTSQARNNAEGGSQASGGDLPPGDRVPKMGLVLELELTGLE
jgi:hypothetical protein